MERDPNQVIDARAWSTYFTEHETETRIVDNPVPYIVEAYQVLKHTIDFLTAQGLHVEPVLQVVPESRLSVRMTIKRGDSLGWFRYRSVPACEFAIVLHTQDLRRVVVYVADVFSSIIEPTFNEPCYLHRGGPGRLLSSDEMQSFPSVLDPASHGTLLMDYQQTTNTYGIPER